MRPSLTFRAAMDVHGDRALAGEACGRTVQESGNRSPVEALPADQLWLGNCRGVQAAHLAVRPALDGARGDVVRVHICRGAHRFEGHAELAATGLPLEPAADGDG